MLFVGLGSAAASSVSEPVDLVLAVKEGDSVAWAQKYADRARVIAYNKGQQALGLSSVSEVALPNVGREAHAYLHHIVHRFDSLAEKTVFMPGGLPTSGFHGFAQSGGSLLPGATLEDYLSADSEELMVPTMALSKDLKQFSVRMSLMDNKTEANVEGGKRFGVCSADGSAGWSPFLPNKFASSVLEPLMAQQHAQWDFPSFWARYMPTTPLPERVLAAHGAVFSVSRESIRSHPKHFYEGLLAELEQAKDPYQAFFLEHMWWYIFHSASAAPCEADFAPEGATRAAASRQLARRKLANVYTIVSPHQGQQVDFGSTINVQWSVNNDGYHRVELWRYGSFVTRVYNSMHGYANTIKEINWHVEPGPQADAGDPASGPNKTYGALQDGAQITPGMPKTWLQFFRNFQPGDHYTVRVCAYSENEDEEVCDETYGESGEFNINAVVRMITPVQANTYYPGDFIPITWQSYFVSGNEVEIIMKTENHVVWRKKVSDTGAYTRYATPDLTPGLYTIEVVGVEPPEVCEDLGYDEFRKKYPRTVDRGYDCAWANTGFPGSTRCKQLEVTACGSNPPLVTHSAAVPAVMGGVNNSVVITAAVPANTSGGNPWPTTSVGQGITYGSKQSASLQSVSPTVTVGSAGDATTVHKGHFPSPGVDGIQCSVGDIWDEEKFKFMGSGFEPTTQGTHHADALRDGCPVACGTCPQSFYHQSSQQWHNSGVCQSSVCKTLFTMAANPLPPAPPFKSPDPAPQWEVPIIQAFKGSFGLDEIKQGPGPHGSTISSTSTVSSGTHAGNNPPSGLNCDYVCHVYAQSNGIVGGRRLLFGGLQSYSGVDTNVFVGCSQDMKDCGCCPGSPAAQGEPPAP